jgi:DNA replication protein DnaC
MPRERTKPPAPPPPEPPARPADDVLRARLREHIAALGIIDLCDETLDDVLSWALHERPSYTQLLERVLGQVAARRRERTTERRIVSSGIKVRKALETFDWSFQPKLGRAAIEELAGLGFISRRQDLLITGKSGTGKSHILTAIAIRACQAGLAVRFARFADVLAELHAGLADGSYERRLRRWCSADFVVLDDVGLGQVPPQPDAPTAAHMLFNLIDLRHQRGSTAITSNIKLSAWGKYLGDATVTAAVLDRLAMTAIRLDIDGPSYRQHLAHQRAEPLESDPELDAA